MGAFSTEMQGWVAEEWVYGVLWGAGQPVGTPVLGVAHCLGDWRL